MIAVIPARLASSRLPNKPLADIGGLPMIERVRRAVVASEACDRVIVATEDRAIAEVVLLAGGEVIAAGPAGNGTERVALAVEKLGYDGPVINVQGDMPLLDPAHVREVARMLRAHGDPRNGGLQSPYVATLATPWHGDPYDPDVVKVWGTDGWATGFSRVPHPAFVSRPLRHLGVYGFAAGVIQMLVALPEHPLEREERLEQLRWLYARAEIGFSVVDSAHPGVDTPEQLAVVRQIVARET